MKRRDKSPINNISIPNTVIFRPFQVIGVPNLHTKVVIVTDISPRLRIYILLGHIAILCGSISGNVTRRFWFFGYRLSKVRRAREVFPPKSVNWRNCFFATKPSAHCLQFFSCFLIVRYSNSCAVQCQQSEHTMNWFDFVKTGRSNPG